jgi:hypothetical protein
MHHELGFNVSSQSIKNSLRPGLSCSAKFWEYNGVGAACFESEFKPPNEFFGNKDTEVRLNPFDVFISAIEFLCRNAEVIMASE